MRNTIILSSTIFLIASFFIYQKVSESRTRAKCVERVYKEKNLREEKYKKEYPLPSDHAYAEMDESMGIGPHKLKVAEANQLYRACLAEHGMKPEDLN